MRSDVPPMKLPNGREARFVVQTATDPYQIQDNQKMRLATKSHLGGWVLHCAFEDADVVIKMIRKIQGIDP